MLDLRRIQSHDVRAKKRLIPLLVTASIMLSLSGCKTENTVTDSGGGGSLLDPHVMPRVIATYPDNGTTGPFGLFTMHQNYTTPHFIIQFNKVINTLAFGSNWISVQGFDRPVLVRPLLRYYYYPLRKTSQSSDEILTNVVGFSVFDSLGSQGLKQYRLGQTYTVTANAALEDFNENHLQQPYQFSFTPEPYFRFLSSSPRDGEQSVRPWSTLSISFNSPINANLFSSLQMVPPVPGRWFILDDSSSADFQHPRPFPFNTSITVSVNAGAVDGEGHLIHSPASFTFKTKPFEVTGTYPQQLGQFPLGLTQAVQINFSGPIDTSTVRNAFSISPDVGISLIPYSEVIFFRPSGEFKANTAYIVTLGTGLQGDDGTPLTTPVSLSFTTDRFHMSGTNPSNGSDGVDRGTVIYVYFNSLIDTGSVRSSFSVTPSTAGTFDFDTPPTDRFGFRPNTHLAAYTIYTVTISGAMRSGGGNTLGSPNEFSFGTGL
jgi:hypothetical protein